VAASNFDTTRLRLGDLVAAASGVVLFLSLFLHWYSVSGQGVFSGISGGVSGVKILSFIDLLLFIVAFIAIGVAVARIANAMPRLAVSPGLIVLVAGALATLLVLYRLLVTPGDLDTGNTPGIDVGRSIGIFIAFLAALGVTAGGWMTWNEEGKPKPGGGGTTAPVGGYQQQAAAAPPAAAAPTPVAAPPAAAAPTPAVPADPPPPGGAADWYPDPRGEKRLRYWDGSQWTHHTAD
jgi:hypothetical protein